MGRARRKAILEAHASKLRLERFKKQLTLPRRLLKSFVNVLSIVPMLVVMAFAQGFERDEWIWTNIKQ